jgi:thioredoxin-related protein
MKLTLSFPAILLIILLFPVLSSAQIQPRVITIHLRGVYESKISLLALTESRTFKPILEVPGVQNGDTARLLVTGEYLPGEFVLRFDYREQESDTPYPSEKYIFINDQDLELRVSPMYCNNADSTWFQAGERENATYTGFSKENGGKREKLGVLQNFLMNYDETGSPFYQQGIEEYERRREAYNQWLAGREQQDKDLFVSSLYPFQFVPRIPLKGSETDRITGLINHYFDGMDFKNPWLIRTSYINKWMDSYVNLYGQQATTYALRDSLFSEAGQTAIEKAKKGDPLVYGWMVDYFYRGYETNGITAGMKVLEHYLSDPDCLTSKRQEINRRLEGMRTLFPGVVAPDINMIDAEGILFELHKTTTQSPYILILFWSADCSHCVELTDEIYPWQQQDVSQKVTVVAISLDETESEIIAFEKKMGELKGWNHLRAEEGIRSKVAADYYVLSAPVMILIDSGTKEIIGFPESVRELTRLLK